MTLPVYWCPKCNGTRTLRCAKDPKELARVHCSLCLTECEETIEPAAEHCAPAYLAPVPRALDAQLTDMLLQCGEVKLKAVSPEKGTLFTIETASGFYGYGRTIAEAVDALHINGVAFISMRASMQMEKA